MKIIVSMDFPKEVINFMKDRYKKYYSRIANIQIELYFCENRDDYDALKDIVREFYQFFPPRPQEESDYPYNRDYMEHIYVEFEDEEYLTMDKLEFTGGKLILRNITDIYKSYDIEDCPECWEYTNIRQKAPLYFSGPTVKSDTIYTDFGEIIVSEKVKRVMEENDVAKGVEFERVQYPRRKTPIFYQWKIQHKTGKMICPKPYPLYEARVRCPVCGNLDTSWSVISYSIATMPLDRASHNVVQTFRFAICCVK